MYTFWQSCWNILFPPTEDERRVFAATQVDVLRYYQPRSHVGHITLASYQHPLIRSLITTNKFTANRHAAWLLGSLLRTYFTSLSDTVTLTTVPLSQARYRERGHNQTTTILRTPTQPSPCIVRPLLRRTRNTAPQTQCSKEERRKNVQAAFVAKATLTPVATNTIYLIDDVVTTGYTLKEAKQALQKRYPKHAIYSLAIARSAS